MTNVEIITCERCGTEVERLSNDFLKPPYLNRFELEYINDVYDGNICAECVSLLQDEFRVMVGIG